MIDKEKKIALIIRITGIIIIILCFCYFIKKDLVLSGELNYKSDFKQKLPMISILYPEHRRTKIENGFILNESPVYFDFRSPIEFDKAQIKIIFKNLAQNNILLSVKNDSGDWTFTDYYLFEKNKEIISDNFTEKDILIDLENAKIENGNIKFMISVENISNTNQKPIIQSVDAKLYLNEKRELFEALKESLNSIYNNIEIKILKLKNKIKSL